MVRFHCCVYLFYFLGVDFSVVFSFNIWCWVELLMPIVFNFNNVVKLSFFPFYSWYLAFLDVRAMMVLSMSLVCTFGPQLLLLLSFFFSEVKLFMGFERFRVCLIKYQMVLVMLLLWKPQVRETTKSVWIFIILLLVLQKKKRVFSMNIQVWKVFRVLLSLEFSSELWDADLRNKLL